MRILFITLMLFLSPGSGFTEDVQLARVDSRCIDAACVQAANQSKSVLADFSPTRVQLLLSGIALIAVRLLAKKYLPRKAAE
jgi:hypothetical protein